MRYVTLYRLKTVAPCLRKTLQKPWEGFEPSTCRLRGGRSTGLSYQGAPNRFQYLPYLCIIKSSCYYAGSLFNCLSLRESGEIRLFLSSTGPGRDLNPRPSAPEADALSILGYGPVAEVSTPAKMCMRCFEYFYFLCR
jgi:hypothetical protein